MLVSVGAVKESRVTTAAMAIGATWSAKRRVAVAELDPSGGDVAARFSLDVPPPVGLVSYAGASRRDHRAELLLEHCRMLPPALPVLLGPPSAERAEAAVGTLDEALLGELAASPDVDVIADCGRLYAGSPAFTVVRSSQVLVLVTRPRPEHLYHLVSALPALAGLVPRIGVVLAGRSSMGTAEVAELLQVEVLGVLPEDPQGAALLGGRPVKRWPRLWQQLPLVAAAQAIAGRLADVGNATPDVASTPRPAMPRQLLQRRTPTSVTEVRP